MSSKQEALEKKKKHTHKHKDGKCACGHKVRGENENNVEYKGDKDDGKETGKEINA